LFSKPIFAKKERNAPLYANQDHSAPMSPKDIAEVTSQVENQMTSLVVKS